jgi:hypothetical protein
MCVSNFAGVSHLALWLRMVASHGPHGRPSITRSICPEAQESPPTFKENYFFERTMRECYVRPNGADRQWVEVPPR